MTKPNVTAPPLPLVKKILWVIVSLTASCHIISFVFHVKPEKILIAQTNKDTDAHHHRSDDNNIPSVYAEDRNTTAHEESTTTTQINTIKSINLIGERHSGTKWITSQLDECFGDRIAVKNRYTRYKHWFQHNDESKDDTYYHSPNSSLVVSIIRDPYDWVDSMVKKPYHSPNHFDLDWKTFVTKEWTMGYRYHGDEDLIKSGTHHNATCMHRFSFNEIIPCSNKDRNWNNITRNRKPVGVIYELNHDNRSGQPYESIIDLRRDKILNFLDVANYDGVASFIPIQYEYMVSYGTRELIEQVASITGIEPRCNPTPPRQAKSKTFDPEYIEWMNDHIDWDVEKLVGYSKNES